MKITAEPMDTHEVEPEVTDTMRDRPAPTQSVPVAQQLRNDLPSDHESHQTPRHPSTRSTANTVSDTQNSPEGPSGMGPVDSDLPIVDPDESIEITHVSEPTAPPQTGDQVGQYRLQDKLGQGVSAFVFRGWDEVNQCPVALKIVNWANVYDLTAAMRQMRIEAAALSRVKHPRVVRFIDLGFDERWPYLVTEYIDGQPLGELLRGAGALPVEWSVYLISQIVDGLGAVWRANLVHRDIKPDNILVTPSGVAKLIDFGLAKAPVLQANVKQAGPEVAGTAAYLAPEQALDAGLVDLRADIYSLGVTFYEALVGCLPFESKNRMQMIFHHINTPPTPPTELNPAVPPLVSDMCLWMLSKQAEARPQNYDELRHAFDTIMAP